MRLTHSVTDKNTGSDKGSEGKRYPGQHCWFVSGLGQILHLLILLQMLVLPCWGYLHGLEGEKKNQKYLLEMVRQTTFRTIMIGVGTTAMGFYSEGEEIGLKSERGISKREFIAEEQGRGQWMENY